VDNLFELGNVAAGCALGSRQLPVQVLNAREDVLVLRERRCKQWLCDERTHLRLSLLKCVEKLDHKADLLIVHDLLEQRLQHHQGFEHKFNLLERYQRPLSQLLGLDQV